VQTGENNFWNQVAQQVNPGWNVQLDSAGTAQDLLASYDTFVYLVDTSTMWVAAGATKSSELLHASRQLQKSKLSPGIVAGAAGNAIIECGAAQLASDHAQTHKALTAAICAITASATWGVVMDRLGSPAGHWIWLAYKLRAGAPEGRPIFTQSKRAFLSPDELTRALRAGLSNDLANTRSTVNQRVKAGGGAELCESIFEWFPRDLATS